MKKIIMAVILVCMSSSAFAATQAECDYQYNLMIDAKIDGEDAMSDNSIIADDIETRKVSAHTAYEMYKMQHGANPNIESILDDADLARDLMVEYNDEAFQNYCHGIGEQDIGDDWYSVSQWNSCLPRYEEAEDWYAGMIFWYNLAVAQAWSAYDDYNEVMELCQ